MNDAQKILDACHTDATEAARIAYALTLHFQDLDDAMDLLRELRTDYFEPWVEPPADVVQSFAQNHSSISAAFRMIQELLTSFIIDLDAARGVVSDVQRERLSILYDHQ